jgi:hypothetical protein
MAVMGFADGSGPPRLTLWQRFALRRLLRTARKHPRDPLSPEDSEAYFRFAAQRPSRAVKRILRSLPTSPRCGYCGAPFAGIGGHVVRPLGYRPSRKNPNLCAVCVELAPPGGMTIEVGVLFADLQSRMLDRAQGDRQGTQGGDRNTKQGSQLSLDRRLCLARPARVAVGRESVGGGSGGSPAFGGHAADRLAALDRHAAG